MQDTVAAIRIELAEKERKIAALKARIYALETTSYYLYYKR